MDVRITRSMTKLNTRKNQYARDYMTAPPKSRGLKNDLEKFRRKVKSRKRRRSGPKLHPLYSRYEPDEFFQFKYNNVATRKIVPKIAPIKKSREASEDSNDMFM